MNIVLPNSHAKFDKHNFVRYTGLKKVQKVNVYAFEASFWTDMALKILEYYKAINNELACKIW